jgi:hypothetical protein
MWLRNQGFYGNSFQRKTFCTFTFGILEKNCTQIFLFPIITLYIIELQARGRYMKSYDRLGVILNYVLTMFL